VHFFEKMVCVSKVAVKSADNASTIPTIQIRPVPPPLPFLQFLEAHIHVIVIIFVAVLVFLGISWLLKRRR